MKQLALSIFLLSWFGLSNAGIVTAEHKIVKAKNNNMGSSQLELAITLTNHGGRDIEHAHLHFENAGQLNLFSQLSPLLVERIPAGSRITVNWKVEGAGSPDKWKKGHSISLTGQGVVEDDFLVPLKVLSESVVSLD